MTTTFRIERGDVVVNQSSGQPFLIADGAKLRQDLRGALATEVREDNVGVGLEDVIQGRAATPSLVQRTITQRVRSMVGRFQSLQVRFNRAQRPRDEVLLRLKGVTVSTVAEDPTAYQFRAEFLSARSPNDPIVFTGRIA